MAKYSDIRGVGRSTVVTTTACTCMTWCRSSENWTRCWQRKESDVEHTPIPWSNHNNNISGGNDRAVALTDVYIDTNDFVRSRAENDANAAFIVKAVNNHQALLKALQTAQEVLDMVAGHWDTPQAQEAADCAARTAMKCRAVHKRREGDRMSKQELVTTTGEPVDWESVAKKHPKLIVALRCIGIELRSMMEAAVHPKVEEKKPTASKSSTTLEAVAFTVRPSSTGREGFIEVVFPTRPPDSVCKELSAAGFRYTSIEPPHWYGRIEKLPARYKENVQCLSASSAQTFTSASAPTPIALEPQPTAHVPTVQPTSKTASDAPSSCGESKEQPTLPTTQKADSVNAPEPPALFVRRTLGGTMDRGYSVVHAGSNKAIGSAYTNLTEEEANKLLAIVLPMADWKMPVGELLRVPGLKDKLAQTVSSYFFPKPATPPAVEVKAPEVVVLPATPAAPVDKGKPEPGKEYALTGAKGTPAISNGNTWAESEVKPEAKPSHAARLRALCKKGG